MDKLDSTFARTAFHAHELLGSIRLPNGRVKRNAGTEVTTDNHHASANSAPAKRPPAIAWKETGDYTNDLGEGFTLNEYFVSRPEMMLGRMRLSGRMYRDNEPTLESDKRDLSEALTKP